MAKRWTEDEDTLLLKLREEGFTAREMTVYVDRSLPAIKSRLSQIAVKKIRRAWTKEELELLHKLRKEGRTMKHIAFKLDRTVKAVEHALSKAESSLPYLDGNSS